ncbi:MAG: hypothetical protein HY015_00445 [Bacteroidetes bacterium]|nr:hypothetical protein [Bacteroidota bacterium]MBI3481446.1 hypothetical protein [Bacteroidota bacterium]
MKIRTTYVFFFLFFCFGLNCSNDPLPTVCVDPLGADNVRVKKNQTFCFKIPFSGCTYDGCFWLTPDLPQGIRAYKYFSPCTLGEIADVGVVKCLSEVAKPISGFTNTVVPALHHGYVIRFPDSTYGRFFIDSWYQHSGYIDSMYVTRHYPFAVK